MALVAAQITGTAVSTTLAVPRVLSLCRWLFSSQTPSETGDWMEYVRRNWQLPNRHSQTAFDPDHDSIERLEELESLASQEYWVARNKIDHEQHCRKRNRKWIGIFTLGIGLGVSEPIYAKGLAGWKTRMYQWHAYALVLREIIRVKKQLEIEQLKAKEQQQLQLVACSSQQQQRQLQSQEPLFSLTTLNTSQQLTVNCQEQPQQLQLQYYRQQFQLQQLQLQQLQQQLQIQQFQLQQLLLQQQPQPQPQLQQLQLQQLQLQLQLQQFQLQQVQFHQ